MPEVSGSSSRLVPTAKSAVAFDFGSQQGIANLLKQLRTSSLSAQTKTTIREMILRYVQTGGDAGVKDELEIILASLSLIPENDSTVKIDKNEEKIEESIKSPLKIKPALVKSFGFSSGRPVPSFINQNSERTESIKNPEPVEAVQPVANETFVPTESTVVPSDELVSEQILKETSTQSTGALNVESNYTDRILEIKREVITLVGNPVNLVDIDNAVGKQYMTSLLEAMKKTNGGTKEEATQAMINLEQAFVAVKGVAQHDIKAEFEPSPNQIPVTQVKSPLPPVAIVDTTPESEFINTQIPDPVQMPAPTAMSPEPVTSTISSGIKENLVQDEEVWKKIATEQSIESTDNQQVSLNQKPEQKEERKLGGVPLQDIPTYGFSKPGRSVGLSPKPNLSASLTTNETYPAPPPPAQNLIPNDVSKVALYQPKEIGDDLMTPDITIGLTQLLAEWKIFKGSGLFGMGPGGIDHPLYVNIKDSSMISIMNGTFNGATGEIQQSIGDYINGWRYEQSIVPQHSETFEHFLRRVVRKVLKDAKR